MYIEEIQRKYKEYFKDVDDRCYELLWTYFFYNYQNIVSGPTQPNVFLKTPSIPNINKIKNDYFSLFERLDQDYFIQASHLLVKSRIIPNEYLKWINTDNELLIFWLTQRAILKHNSETCAIKIENKEIYNRISPKNNTSAFITNKPSEYLNFSILFNAKKQSKFLYENFIYEIDKLNINLEEKINFIQELKKEWFSNREKYELKKWINESDSEKLNWINEYIEKKPPIKIFASDDIKFAANTASPYHSVVIKLCDFSFNSLDSRELYIEKMKKSWSQKKFRDAGKTKKPHHLPMTKDSIKKIKKLSQLLNMTEQKIIETLIEEKYQKEATRHGIPLYED